MIKVLNIGSEVEFSPRVEEELKTFFLTLNSGKLYNILLTRKRGESRLYCENDCIFEYRSPVISGDSYYRFAKYYFFVSYFSEKKHVEGCYDGSAGSMHTHLDIDEVALNSSKLNRLIMLNPLMGRYYSLSVPYFRDAVISDDGLAQVYYKNPIEEDSKTYWITYNTGTNCVEVRLNENVPVWYLLADETIEYIEPDDFYYFWESPSACLPYIERTTKRKIELADNMSFKTDIQKRVYIDLLEYILFYLDNIREKKKPSIKTFSKYLLEYSPMRKNYKNILDIYMETEKTTYNSKWN